MRYFPSAPNKIGLESDPLAVESLNLKSEKKIKTSLSTYAFRFILIFASYYITGHLGLKIDAENDFATLIWAPSGIALAALYVWGTDYWPAVFLSATLVNVAQHATIFSDVAIGIGNVAEVILGVYILKKYKQFDTSLSKLSDIIAIIIAAIVTSIPDAFIGTAVCWMESVTAAGGVASTWKAWWLGDTMGIMIVAPLIFVLGNQKKPTVTLLKLLEVGFLILAFISINLFAFTNIFKGFEATLFSQPYILFPCVIWAAFRFGQEGTVTAIFIISVFAMAGTALNIGPFAQETIRGNLYLLDGFIIIIAVTGLSLAAAVTERKTAIADLKAIEGQLKDAIRHRDDFLSIASHELKTPITSLSLQLQITERSIDVKKNILPSPQKLAQTLDMSRKQINRLAYLIEDLFDVSRFQSGRLNFIFEKINLSALVRDMSDRSYEQFQKIESAVEVQIQDSVFVNGDYARLEQVMDNLISNAIKYAPGSPFKISLSADHARAVIKVEDRGPGIAKEKQDKIFNRYERASESKNISGLGLGLFIVSEIIKAHEGTISLDSESGKSTVFCIELPIERKGESSFG